MVEVRRQQRMMGTRHCGISVWNDPNGFRNLERGSEAIPNLQDLEPRKLKFAARLHKPFHGMTSLHTINGFGTVQTLTGSRPLDLVRPDYSLISSFHMLRKLCAV